MAIAGVEKGLPPKDLFGAKRAFPGAARNTRGTVIGKMECCRDEREGLPCAAMAWGFMFLKNILAFPLGELAPPQGGD